MIFDNCIHSKTTGTIKINVYIAQRSFLMLFCSLNSLPPSYMPSLHASDFLSLQISLHFLEFHMNDIIPRYAFVSHFFYSA